MPEPEYLPLAEAAPLYRLSPDTLRRRILEGRLSGRQERRGGRSYWTVARPLSEATGEGQASSPETELVSILRLELEAWRRQAETREREVAELHVLLQRALERPALPSGNPSPPAPAAPQGEASASSSEQGSERRSWWERLFKHQV